VVELQNARIAFPAVETRARREVLEHMLVRSLAPRVASSVHLLDVRRAALAEIRLEALSAPPLVAVLVAVECVEREGPFASLTPPLGHERMFPSEPDGIAVVLVPEVPSAREDHCHACCVAGVDCCLVVL
jgi:hypothetical protein